MKKILFPLMLLLLVTISCKKDSDNEDPIVEETKYFNFTVGSNYNTDNEYQRIRNWVLVYSEENELLINLELENDNEYGFSDLELPQSGLSLQIITYTEQRGINDTVFNRKDKVSFAIYEDVMPGYWKFTKSVSNEYFPIGYFDVEINGFNSSDYLMAELKSSYDFAYDFHDANSYQLQKYINNDYLWLSLINKGEIPRFKKISNVESGSQIVLNYSDLDVMSDYVDISLPENENVYVYIESEDDYSSEYWDYNTVFFNGFDNGVTTIRTYYPGDAFSGYYSYFTSTMGNIRNYQLTSRGSIPNQLKTLGIDLSLSHSNINDFKAIVNGVSDMLSLYWQYDSSNEDIYFEYSVNFPSGSNINFSAPIIPENIIAQLPSEFDINSFEYKYFLANEFDVFDGYQDYIQSYYINNFDLYGQKVERQWQYIYNDIKSIEETNDMEIIENLRRNPYQ